MELNAFTSDQFVKWLESNLQEHQVAKVIPDAATLERAFRVAVGRNRCQAILEREVEKVDSYAARVPVPDDLAEQVRDALARSPQQSWDEAIEDLLPPVTLED